MSLFKRTIQPYWHLVLLKNNPEDTSYSPALCTLGLLSLVLVLTGQWRFSNFDFSNDLLLVFCVALSLVFSIMVYTGVLLFLRGLKARWIQTLSSLSYTQSIIHLLSMPLLLLEPYVSALEMRNSWSLFIGIAYLLLVFLLSLWQFVVTSHIYKHALGATSIQGVLAAFGLMAANILTLSFW